MLVSGINKMFRKLLSHWNRNNSCHLDNSRQNESNDIDGCITNAAANFAKIKVLLLGVLGTPLYGS